MRRNIQNYNQPSQQYQPNHYQGQNQQQQQQDFQDHLIKLLQTISHCLKIPLPQNPFTFLFVHTVLKKIFPSKQQYSAKNWKQIIKFLQTNVVDDKMELPDLSKNIQNQQEIYQILMLLTDLAQIKYQEQYQKITGNNGNNRNQYQHNNLGNQQNDQNDFLKTGQDLQQQQQQNNQYRDPSNYHHHQNIHLVQHINNQQKQEKKRISKDTEKYLNMVKIQQEQQAQEKQILKKQKEKKNNIKLDSKRNSNKDDKLFKNKKLQQKNLVSQIDKQIKKIDKKSKSQQKNLNINKLKQSTSKNNINNEIKSNTRPSTAAVNATKMSLGLGQSKNCQNIYQQKNKNIPLLESSSNTQYRKPGYPTKIDPKADLQQQIIKTVKQTMKTKLSNKNPKTCKLMNDNKGNEAVEKAKRKFDYQLQQYKRELKKIKTINKNPEQYKAYLGGKAKKQEQNQFIDSAYLKFIAKKHKDIQQTIVNQQLQYYLTLRDKKLKYIQNIHKIMIDLEKERQIDLHKQQRQHHKKQKQTIKKKIEAVQNVFTGNLQNLKEQYKNRRKNAQIKGVNQINFCRQIQKQIVKKKQQEMDQMKILWEQQCRKLEGITGDQQKVEKKLLKIYRQNRV